MQYMFCNCIELDTLKDLSNWKTEKLEYMNNMFENCKKMRELPGVSGWNIKNVQDMSNMFKNFNEKITTRPEWYEEN